MKVTGSSTEKTIWNYFIVKGMSPAGVAGLMGNLYAESGLNPQNLQNTYEKRLGFTDASYTAAVDSAAPTPTSSETGLATASHSGHTGAARRPCSTTRRRPVRPSAT